MQTHVDSERGYAQFGRQHLNLVCYFGTAHALKTLMTKSFDFPVAFGTHSSLKCEHNFSWAKDG